MRVPQIPPPVMVMKPLEANIVKQVEIPAPTSKSCNLGLGNVAITQTPSPAQNSTINHVPTTSNELEAVQVASILTIRPEFTIKSDFSSHFVLSAALTDSKRSGLVVNHFNCNSIDPKRIGLSEGAQRIFNSPNAGGNSVWSETLSFEVLNNLLGAKLLLTEMEINYFPMGGKITDYSVTIFGNPIGVSVTRALKFKGEFTETDAILLLSKKLYGINESTRLVVDEHKWNKQMLHIWAENQLVANVLIDTWKKLDCKLTSNTLVLITVSGKNAKFLYK